MGAARLMRGKGNAVADARMESPFINRNAKGAKQC
jgi:hypothetical protein